MERSQKTNYQDKLPLAVDVDQVEVLDIAGTLTIFYNTFNDRWPREESSSPFRVRLVAEK
jgi:hypothetical protein